MYVTGQQTAEVANFRRISRKEAAPDANVRRETPGMTQRKSSHIPKYIPSNEPYQQWRTSCINVAVTYAYSSEWEVCSAIAVA